MNAAFLLMTSAMLVGQGGDKKVDAPKPAPAAVASSCGNDCDCNGNRFGHRLRGLFQRDCDTCKPAPTTCHTHCDRQPLFRSRCSDACAPKWTWHQSCREPRCCETKCHAPKACAPTCHDSCERQGFLARLRERFQRNDCCCTTVAPAKAPEKIETPPKKLDKGKTEGVRIETRSTPNVIQVAPTVPTVEVTPNLTPAPRVDGNRRDPF